MIHEDITISGSFQASGSFILPRIPSNSLATATTGSMFYDTVNDVVKIYTGTGSTSDGYVTVGAQSEPAAAGGGGVASDDIEYLVIAGGSSGGRGSGRSGGGGGAGGYLSSSLSSIESGSEITVTVGAGGAAKSGADGQGNDGSDSTLVSAAGTSFTAVTAVGGGGGGYPSSGRDGGSGGGGAHGGTSGGSGTVGQGNDGGDGSGESPYAGAGGGGAGAAGSNSSAGSAGAGGNGLASSITGTSITRAGGGGGGGSVDAAGGTGGGGHGATGTANPGAANSGSGGGGAQTTSGAGGSGIVVLAYPTSSITATGGIKTTRSDGQFVHIFKESGTLTVGGADFHTIAPSENFNIVTFTGNGGTQSVTGVNFQPDLVWMKNRTDTVGHRLYDSIRGDSYYLESDTNAANTGAGTAGLTSFDSDGFSVGLGNAHNGSSDNIVAWCWKANGGTTSSVSGTNISSATQQVNTDIDFSITQFTEGSSGTSVVPHGLSGTPDMYIVKRSGGVQDWYVWHSGLSAGNSYLILNSTAAQGSNDNMWTQVDSTNINLGAWNTEGGGTKIIYAFKSVDGFSKFGSYSGNGTNQTITTGFRPAWVMIKASTGTSDYKSWVIFDTQRATAYNDTNLLYANKNAAEGTRGNGSGDGDVLEIITTATGFKLGDASRNNASDEMNDGSTTYIYWAISE